MKPEQLRDKLDLMRSERVDDRVAQIFNAAVLQIMARYCYTREEAETAGFAHFQSKRLPSAPRRRTRQPSSEART